MSALEITGLERVYQRKRGDPLEALRGIDLDVPKGEVHGLLGPDEPAVGMDPVAARDSRALVGEPRGDGTTILMATHDMAEAAALSDRVPLIDQGAPG